MSSKAAKRYAYAFLETALEMDILEEAKKDILMIGDVLDSSKDLRLFLKSPIVRKDQKRAALKEIFEENIHDLTGKLLEILTEKNREALLELITGHFIELYNVHHGIINVDVTSAMELDKEQIKTLKSQLESSTGKKILLNRSIDEDLMGGMMVRIDDTVIDGTVKFKLNQLKDQFSLAAVE